MTQVRLATKADVEAILSVPIYVSTSAPSSPPSQYLWIKIGAGSVVDDIIAVGF